MTTTVVRGASPPTGTVSLSDTDVVGAAAAPVISLLPLYGTDDIDLTLFWRAVPARTAGADVRAREGHHYVLGLTCGPPLPILLPPRAAAQLGHGGDVDGAAVAAALGWSGATATRTATRAALHGGKSRQRSQLTLTLSRPPTTAAGRHAGPRGSVNLGAAIGGAALAATESLLLYRLNALDTIRNDFSAHR